MRSQERCRWLTCIAGNPVLRIRRTGTSCALQIHACASLTDSITQRSMLNLQNVMRRRYKAWKEAGLSQALDADLPVSTGAVWGLQKNTWSSQCVPFFAFLRIYGASSVTKSSVPMQEMTRTLQSCPSQSLCWLVHNSTVVFGSTISLHCMAAAELYSQPCPVACRRTSEAEEPQASRTSSIASKDSAGRPKLKTYSGMLDSYAQSSRR